MITKVLLLSIALILSGCTSVMKLQGFLQTIPAMEITEIKQSLQTPIWSNYEVATGVKTDADGLLNIASATVTIRIPIWGIVSEATMTNFKQIPSAEQIEAARLTAERVEAAKEAARRLFNENTSKIEFKPRSPDTLDFIPPK